MIRIILKDLKIGMSENSVFDVYHPQARELFSVCSSLEKVCKDLRDPHTNIGKSAIQLFEPFKPQLGHKEVPKDVRKVLFEGRFYIEEKIDGERIQMHFEKSSRKFKWFSSLILDGEMIAYDPKLDVFLPFGSLKSAAKDDTVDPHKAHPCFIVFDMVYCNGFQMAKYTLADRLKVLSSVVKEKDGYLALLSREEKSTFQDIVHALDQAIALRKEGLVIKNPGSTYEPGARNPAWIKLKPEYIESLHENCDLIVVGAKYGTGKRGNRLAQFLCAIRDDRIPESEEPRFLTFSMLGTGYTVDELDEIGKMLENFEPYNPKNQPSWLVHPERSDEVPDVIVHYAESVVVEVKATEIVWGNMFGSGSTLRFPRFMRFRKDKSWSDIMTYTEMVAAKRSGYMGGKVRVPASQDDFIGNKHKRAKTTALQSKRSYTLLASQRGVDTRDIEKKSKLFEDMTFYVIVGGNGHSKSSLETKIQENGGNFVQSETGAQYIIAGSKNIRVNSIIKLKTKDIIQPQWVVDCDEKQDLVPLCPRYMLFTTERTDRLFRIKMDQWGDSYAHDTTEQNLREVLSHIEVKLDEEKARQLCEEVQERYFPELIPGMIFLQVKAYLDFPASDGDQTDELSRLKSRDKLWLASMQLQFYGGLVVDRIEPGITHIIMDENRLGQLSALTESFKGVGAFRWRLVLRVVQGISLSCQARSPYRSISRKFSRPANVACTAFLSVLNEPSVMDSGRMGALPHDVLEKLRVLDLELAEGDITEKGYEKKKGLLLKPYAIMASVNSTDDVSDAHTVAEEISDEAPCIHANDPESNVDDPGPEPSAADVVDFLDFLPSPSHSPVQSHREIQPSNSRPALQVDTISVHAPNQPAYDPRLPTQTRGQTLNGVYPYVPRHDTVSQPQSPNTTSGSQHSMYPAHQSQDTGSPHPFTHKPGEYPSRVPYYHENVASPSASLYGIGFQQQHSKDWTMHTRSQSSRTNTFGASNELTNLKRYPSSVPNLGMSPSMEWETASTGTAWRASHRRERSNVSMGATTVMTMSVGTGSPISRHRSFTQKSQSSLQRTRSKYGNSYMATHFKAIEPAPQPKLMVNEPSEQTFLADLAGRQELPLAARKIPFNLLDGNNTDLSHFTDLAQVLRYRAMRHSNKDNAAFTLLDGNGKETGHLSWDKLNARAEKVASLLRKQPGLHFGDRIVLIYRKSEVLEFIVALFGCFFAGMVAVPINAAEDLGELLFILDLTTTHIILTTEYNLKAFTKDMQVRSIELPPNVKWWTTNNVGPWYPRSASESYPDIHLPDLAYIEYAKAINGELKGVTVTHRTILDQCRVYKASVTETDVTLTEQEEVIVTPKQEFPEPDCVVSYLEPRQQMGLFLSVLCSVFAGNHTIFTSSSITDTPAAWIYVLSKYKASIALADYTSLRYIAKFVMSNKKLVQNFNRKVLPDLSALRLLMIETTVVNPELNEYIAENLLRQFGNVDNPLKVVCPVLSLPEHGGSILSFRDFLGPVHLVEHQEAIEHPSPTQRRIVATGGSHDIWECVLDAQAVKRNKVVVVAAGNEVQRTLAENDKGLLRVGSFGFVIPEATVAIVDPETTIICPPETIGEIWVDASFLSDGFWALPKHTESIFHARPVIVPVETLYPELYQQKFLRTGLVGTLIGGRLVVFGAYEDRVRQQCLGEKVGVEETFFASDIIESIRKHLHLEHCVIFDVAVNSQHLPVVVTETTMQPSAIPPLTEDIMQLLVDRHGLRPYAVLAVKPDSLPRHLKHGRNQVHALMVKRAFLSGQLNVQHVRMDVDRTVFNLANGNASLDGASLSSIAYERAIRLGIIPLYVQKQHTGMENVTRVIDERTEHDLSTFATILDIFMWRTQLYPDEPAFMTASEGGIKQYTWQKMSVKIAGVAHYLVKKGFKRGSKALVLMPFGHEWIRSIYACLSLGVVPVIVEPPDLHKRVKEDIALVLTTARELNVSHILVNAQSEEIMKHKLVSSVLKELLGRGATYKMPDYTNVSKTPRYHKMLGVDRELTIGKDLLNAATPALISVHCSPSGNTLYAALDHKTILNQCGAQKTTCQLKSQRSIVATGLGSYHGLGLLYSAFCGVYVGCTTVLLASEDYHMNPALFFELLHRFKAKDVVVSHPLIQFALNRLSANETRRILLPTLQNLMLTTEERTKPALHHHLTRYFARHQLEAEAINTVYSHAGNPMVTTRSYMLMAPISLELDFEWLRQGIVRPLSPDGETRGVLLHDSGIVPSNTMVAIVDPKTHTLCPAYTIGEIWVSSNCNVKTFIGLSEPEHAAQFQATIAGTDPQITYQRTGDLGFLWNVRRRVNDHMMELPMEEEGQCLFVLGSMSEVIERNGYNHFMKDIEVSVERCQVSISPGASLVLHAGDKIIVIAAMKAPQLARAAVPLIVNAVLENHSFLVDTVVIIHPDHMPRTRYGEKQRRKALEAYLQNTLKEHKDKGQFMRTPEEEENEQTVQSIRTVYDEDTRSAASTKESIERIDLRIMQEYYFRTLFENVPNAAFQLSLVGVLLEVFVNLMGPVGQILQSIAGTKPVLFLGTILATLGLEMAGFSSQIWHLYLTQGICFGAGASLMYVTAIGVCPQWFDKRRGLALGLAASGSGIGGLVLPFVLSPLNNSLGAPWTYRILGFICLGCDLLACAFIKEKYPRKTGRKKLSDIIKLDVLKDSNYVLWCLGSVISLMGYFVPYFFVPTYATQHLGLDSTQGSTLIAVMSAANFIGRITVGFLADRIGRLNADIIYTFLCGLSSMLIWTFATNYGILMAYAVVFGLFCGSYFALLSPITATILEMERFPTGLSLLLMFNVISVFGPSIASGIQSSLATEPFFVYKMFAGVTYLIGGAILLVLKIRMTKNLFGRI
ncbi:hypothetical protein EC973_001365 [Apophysomyces ossiformis]|uniref:DNA ligase n=1 Tax=Apophysomyces ossiformis TaxID=679940 RepID=A0A8H7ESR7_9FUNG|nr:hypothetical protein EC973_001365 [Apophysomyces ossiformis]